MPPAQRLDLEVGARMCRPDNLPWPSSQAQRTVVIIGSATCPVCTNERPFSERLFSRCGELHIPVVYILPDRHDNDSQARDLASLGRSVLRTNLRELGMVRIPTIAAVKPDGTILALWTGSVEQAMEDKLESKITQGTSDPLCRRVPRTGAEYLISRQPLTQILALDNSSSPPVGGLRHKVIPVSELSVRARYEMNSSYTTVVDCGVQTVYECQEALLTLSKMGFHDLVALDLPRRKESGNCVAHR